MPSRSSPTSRSRRAGGDGGEVMRRPYGGSPSTGRSLDENDSMVPEGSRTAATVVGRTEDGHRAGGGGVRGDGGSPITLEHVALAAGVSRATASRVLTGSG